MTRGQPSTSPEPSTCSVFLSRPKCVLQHQRASHVPPQTFPISRCSGSSCHSFCQPFSGCHPQTPSLCPPTLQPAQFTTITMHLSLSTETIPLISDLLPHFSFLSSRGFSAQALMLQCSLHCRVQLLSGFPRAVVGPQQFCICPFLCCSGFPLLAEISRLSVGAPVSQHRGIPELACRLGPQHIQLTCRCERPMASHLQTSLSIIACKNSLCTRHRL